MNIFVENNGPYIYRSIFRKIPRLRQQQPAAEAGSAGIDACPVCGASLDAQVYPATAPAQPEPEYQPVPDYEPEPEQQPDPQPELEPQPEPQQPEPAERLQQQADQQPAIPPGPDLSQYVLASRVLEAFQFLFKTIDDALIDQPALLTRISRAFAEGLASAIGPGPQPELAY